MTVKDTEFEALKVRVDNIDSTINGLKTAAKVLGVSGAVLAALLLWAFRTAWEANSTAEGAKRKAAAADTSVVDATRAGLDKIHASTLEVGTAVTQGLSSISTAESSAKQHLQSYFVASSLTPEKNWAQDNPATPLGVKEGEGFCFLTRVAGNFEGSAEVVRIEVRNGEYVLTGGSHQCCIAATARCLKFTEPA